ncbi:hypothetical protein SH139x_003712 [Planctomycetaceae bacterium SH139]
MQPLAFTRGHKLVVLLDAFYPTTKLSKIDIPQRATTLLTSENFLTVTRSRPLPVGRVTRLAAVRDGKDRARSGPRQQLEGKLLKSSSKCFAQAASVDRRGQQKVRKLRTCARLKGCDGKGKKPLANALHELTQGNLE